MPSSSPTAATAIVGSDATPTALIALDWGTSSLRAYRLDRHGATLATRSLPWGVMNLPPSAAGSAADSGFIDALQQACGDWHAAAPSAALIACGMVGSKQGWHEVPYLTLPLSLAQIGQQLTRFDTGHGMQLHLVPGVLQQSILPNVMRGEETQVLGALTQHSGDDMLIGLPGTHSKWVRVRNQTLMHFDTFMTGEVYAALSKHTILGRTMQAGAASDDAAFARGLAVAGSEAAAAGVLSTIFSCRTLGLSGALAPTAQADYLSGVLIGHEIAALQQMTRHAMPQQIILIGTAALCARYQTALALYDMTPVSLALQATPHGLWKLALAAGLLPESVIDSTVDNAAENTI